MRQAFAFVITGRRKRNTTSHRPAHSRPGFSYFVCTKVDCVPSAWAWADSRKPARDKCMSWVLEKRTSNDGDLETGPPVSIGLERRRAASCELCTRISPSTAPAVVGAAWRVLLRWAWMLTIGSLLSSLPARSRSMTRPFSVQLAAPYPHRKRRLPGWSWHHSAQSWIFFSRSGGKASTGPRTITGSPLHRPRAGASIGFVR